MSKRVIVTVSDELYEALQKLAKNMGVTPTEYIRFLILRVQEKETDLVSQLGL